MPFQKTQPSLDAPIKLIPKKKTKATLTKSESARWMSLQETADHFRVSEATVRQGCGVFGELRTVKIGKRRLVLRSSVDALDRRLERMAVAVGSKEAEDVSAVA